MFFTHYNSSKQKLKIQILEHGSWSQWTDWDSECQKSDVDSNVWRKSRTRTCTDPEPKYGGDDCNGIATESIECDPSMYFQFFKKKIYKMIIVFVKIANYN